MRGEHFHGVVDSCMFCKLINISSSRITVYIGVGSDEISNINVRDMGNEVNREIQDLVLQLSQIFKSRGYA
jgi:hypothetical protein